MIQNEKVLGHNFQEIDSLLVCFLDKTSVFKQPDICAHIYYQQVSILLKKQDLTAIAAVRCLMLSPLKKRWPFLQ